MSANKMAEMQHQIRANSECLKDYLTDLENWENEMKKKDSAAKRSKQECPGASGDAKTAEEMKNAGNESFKSGKFDEAVEYYSRGIRADPGNAALLANRALAYMKIGKTDLAEKDCTSCLALDPRHVKAHLRRGAIRLGGGRLAEAREDFAEVLRVEPKNREALAELEKIRGITSEMAGHGLHADSGRPEHLRVREELGDGRDQFIINPSERPPPGGKKPTITTISATKGAGSPQSNEGARKRGHNAPGKTVATGPTLEFQTGTTLPGVPDKSYQFFSDWMRLEGHRDLRYQYLRNFPARRFPEMFRHSMEAEVFSGILRVLREEFLPRGDDVFEYVKFLAGVGRFKTLLCMLSELEKKYVGDLMRHIESSDGHDAGDKSDIRRMYEQ